MAEEKARGTGRDPHTRLDEGKLKDAPDTYEALRAAGHSEKDSPGLIGRMNQRFQDALQSGRGQNRRAEPSLEAGASPHVTADDLALRRARHVQTRKMIIPEGVIIDGSMTSGSETEIAGRIEGNVNVDGELYLGSTALISGSVRATRCKIEGMVEGGVECGQDLELSESGRLSCNVMAGRTFTVAGQVFGDVACAGLLRLTSSAKIHGDVRCKRIIIDEGGVLNGSCAMRPPSQRQV